MAIESQFYLLLPIITFVLLRLIQKSRHRLLVGLVSLGFLASFIFGLIYWYVLAQHLIELDLHMTIFFVFGYFTLFATGMFCSYLYVSITEKRGKFKGLSLQNPRFIKLVRIVGLSATALFIIRISLLYFNIGEDTPYSWSLDNTLLAIIYGALLLEVLGGRSFVRRFFSSTAMRFIGTISYSLYIWHGLLFSHVVSGIAQKLSFHSAAIAVMWYIILTLVIVIPFSYISYMLVEKPFIKLRKKETKVME